VGIKELCMEFIFRNDRAKEKAGFLNILFPELSAHNDTMSRFSL